MKIAMQAQVRCTDGLYGYLKSIVLDPKRRQVTHIGAREQRKGGVERLIPLRFVAESTADTILLDCDSVRARRFNPLIVEEFVADADSIYGREERGVAKYEQLPEGTIAVREGTAVRATDGKVGSLAMFLVDPTGGQITHFVLREGHLWSRKEATIPISDVDGIREKTIYLNIDKQAVGKLPAVPARRGEKQRVA